MATIFKVIVMQVYCEKSGLTGTRTQNQYLKRVLLYH